MEGGSTKKMVRKNRKNRKKKKGVKETTSTSVGYIGPSVRPGSIMDRAPRARISRADAC